MGLGCASAGEPQAAAATQGSPAPVVAPPEPAEPTPADSVTEEEEEEESAEESEPWRLEHTEPPGGVWLVDESGREYFAKAMPKTGMPAKRLSENQIRIAWGFTLDLVDEDDDFFYYKVYRVDPGYERKPWIHVPTDEEKAQVASTYRFDTATDDRWSFVPFGVGLPKTGQWRNGFEIADLNGDGHLDIVHGPPRKSLGPPIVFLGNSQGGFQRWGVAFPPVPFDYGDVAVADFDGDERLDLAVTSHLRGMVAMTRDQEATFKPWTQGIDFELARPGHKGGFSARAVVVVDWNRDGKPDLLALGEGPRLDISRGGRATASSGTHGAVLYLNRGDGTWERKEQGMTDEEIFGDSIAIGDFNGDGLADFVTASNVLGRKDIVNLGQKDGSWKRVSVEGVRVPAYVRAVQVADFDQDGRDDLAVAYMSFELAQWRSGIDVFYSRRDGSWERRAVWVEDGREGIYALGVGDIDGDQRPDIVGTTGAGRAWVFRGLPDGGFVRQATTDLDRKDECRGYHVELADFDGDGRDEIITTYAGESQPIFAPDRCKSNGGMAGWKLKIEAPTAVGR
jgi:hypothetical protein